MTDIARPLEVDDILSYQWGATMTIVEYYKVIAVTPASVKIQKMFSFATPEDRGGSRRVYPVDIDPAEKPMTKRVKASWDATRLGVQMNYGMAYFWSGKPLTENRYD